MKDKPTKWGIKVWTLSDARTGYIYRSLVYTGKSLTERQHGLLGNRVVCELLHGFENTGIYFYKQLFL